MKTGDVSKVYDKKHLANLEKYAKAVKGIFDKMCEEAASIGVSTGFDNSKGESFSWNKFPKARKRFTDLMWRVRKELQAGVESGIEEEWNLSNAKNEELVDSLLGSVGLTMEQIQSLEPRRAEGAKAFQTRKAKGLGLSDRVWNITSLTEAHISESIEQNLAKGTTAHKLSQDVRRDLKDPNMMYRRYHHKITLKDGTKKDVRVWHKRVVDKDGNVHFVVAPLEAVGTGVYRSAYKNAMRLARTEINMAYHKADSNYFASSNIILGIEIKLSNNHTTTIGEGDDVTVPLHDICDELQGKYPRWFDFTGWHPQCRCIAQPITPDRKEMREYLRKIANGEDVSNFKFTGMIEKMPNNFVNWCANNEERLIAMQKRGKLPYFIRENITDGFRFGYNIDIDDAMKWSPYDFEYNEDYDMLMMSEAQPKEPIITEHVKTREERWAEAAEKRHAERTPEMEKAIKERWKQHEHDIEEIKKIIEASKVASTPSWEYTHGADIDACKSIDELIKLMQDRDVFTSRVDFGSMPLEDVRAICHAASDMNARFGLVPIDISWSKNKSYLMAANGRYVDINSKYFAKSNIKKTKTDVFDGCTGRYVEIHIEMIEKYKGWIEKYQDYLDKATGPETKRYYEREIQKLESAIKDIQDTIDLGFTRHNVFESSDSLVRDCFSHEMGHVVHNQLAGGLISYHKQQRIPDQVARDFNTELEKLFFRYKGTKEGASFLSEYGLSKRNEFLAESMVLYMYMPDALPRDVHALFVELEKIGVPQKANASNGKKLSWDDASKKYHEKKARIAEAARKRHEKRDDKAVKQKYEQWKADREKTLEDAKEWAKKASEYNWIDPKIAESLKDPNAKYHIPELKKIINEAKIKVDEVEKDIIELETIIPDVRDKWSKQFSSAELHGAKSAIEKTFGRWTWDFTTDDSLNFLKGRLEREITVVTTNGKKYKTWEVVEKAYRDRLALVNKRISMKKIKDSIETDIKELEKQKGKTSKKLIDDFGKLFDDDDIDIADLTDIADKIKAKADKIRKQNAKKAQATKTSGTQQSMTDDEIIYALLAHLSSPFIRRQDVKVRDGFVDLPIRQHELLYKKMILSQADENITWRRGYDKGYIQTSHSFEINGALRDIKGGGANAVHGDITKADISKCADMYGHKLSSDDVVTIMTMDKILDQNRSVVPLRICRFIDGNAVKNMFGGHDVASLRAIAMMGGTVTGEDLGYMSFSTNSVDNVFKLNRSVMLEIEAPAGTPMYITKNTHESEGILGRGTKLELVSVRTEYNGAGNRHKLDVITLRIVN